MANNKINTIYTAENIEQYFSGKLLPEEMHAMEKAALDDPFLSEAMEGYVAMQQQPWQKQLHEAREKIVAKENNKNALPVIVSLKWWKATAAILIITGGIGMAYFFTRSSSVNNENTAIVTLQKNMVDSNLTAPDSSLTVAANDAAKRVVVIKENNKPLIAQLKKATVSDTASITSLLKKTAETEKVALDDNQNKAADETLAYTPSAPAVSDNTSLPKVNRSEANGAVSANKAMVAQNMNIELNHRFDVTVTAADNTPLPFANVLVLNENVGTYADAKGRFKLVAADSILNIRIRAAGYVSQTYPIKSFTENRIVLNEQQVAAKDIVQLNNKKMPGTMPKMKVQLDTLLNVEPADGWSNYDAYLSNNVIPSSSILEKNIHGEVEVTFDVQSNGTVSNVNIAKSLCAACDEEALRVIKEGPQWKVKKGKKDKGKIKVKF